MRKASKFLNVTVISVLAASSLVALSGPVAAKEEATPKITSNAPAPGAKRLHFKVGPFEILPGQNSIDFTRGIPQPKVDGFVTAIRPDLRRADGTIPAVDVIHLHHGVWLNVSNRDATASTPERFFAAGEEKTATILPDGFGYPYKTTDRWLFNYMLHNLLAKKDVVWVTYDVDFIPASSKAGKSIIPARPIWMDIQNGGVYPVFDAHKGTGTDGVFTYPDQAVNPYPGKALNEWTVDRDMVLVAAGGHLHPGGLYNDLWLRRDGATVPKGGAKPGSSDTAHLFRSNAVYYEPAGAVSWDVAMTVTPQNYRVDLKKGDVLETTVAYDTAEASWYESMGIMVIWAADAEDVKGRVTDPFTKAVRTKAVLTHGHLAENNNHGGKPAPKDFVNALKLPNQVEQVTNIQIENFVYARGDLTVADSVPTVKQGQSITFDNSIDAPLANGIWHTITACKAPCNRSTGVAYPRANADIQFDSGELGIAGPPTADRLTWSTPRDLDTGTYTYFCRVHPSMRGAFRVVAQ